MDSSSPKKNSTTSILATVSYVLVVIIALLIHIGAGKLSYDKYGSIGWAILAGFFAYFYYPYYAFFVSSRQTSMFGGLRKLLK